MYSSDHKFSIWFTGLFIGLSIFFVGLFLFLLKRQFTPIPQPVLITSQAKPASPTPVPALSLDAIFSSSKKEYKADKTMLTMIVTGDVIPARSVNRIVREEKDFTYPFKQTADVLRSADITLINLESPLTKSCPSTNEGMTFCGDQRFIDGLVFAGIDVASLANNHVSNQGKNGIDETVELLQSHGIVPVGLGKAEIIEKKQVRFAFLAYNGVVPLDPNLSPINIEKIKSDIQSVRADVDVVVVSYHWGREYSRSPEIAHGIADDDPVAIGHATIDAGADIVVGNHPHWYQGIELYKGKPIFYALGNFVFDQFWSEETKKGFIAILEFDGKYLKNIRIKPTFIDGIQPIFPDDPLKTEILTTLEEESRKLTKGTLLNNTSNYLGLRPFVARTCYLSERPK